MLEKNRVIHQGSAERNYHIFYQLLYATDDDYLNKLCIPSRKAADYEFLNKGVPTVDAIDDHDEYNATLVSAFYLLYLLPYFFIVIIIVTIIFLNVITISSFLHRKQFLFSDSRKMSKILCSKYALQS